MTKYTFTVYRRTPENTTVAEKIGVYQYQENAIAAAKKAGAVGPWVRNIDRFIYDMDGHEFDDNWTVWVHMERN